MGRAPQRHAFRQTNGRPIFVYDDDIGAVASVNTEKHGACLILKMKGMDDVWILDDPRHRALLGLADDADDLAMIKANRAPV